MADNLRESLLEEIALEGLDGITINALFLRLEERKGFPLRVNDQSRQFIWNCVLDLQDVEFYQLEKPRPELVSFNRFHHVDPDTRHFIEMDELPDDAYPVKVLEEEGVYGSCADFKTRKNISLQVRDAKKPLKDSVEEYGNTLVVVADQDVRVRAIIGSDNDPLLNLSNPSYCILERIARSRYSGETSSGNRSLQSLSQSSKTLFYQIKKFKHLGIVKRQRVCVVKQSNGSKISHFLYHLKRFYSRVLTKQQMELQAIIEHLSKQPENMFEVSKLKNYVKISDKNFKKVSQLCIGAERIFEFIDVPYREIHPNATPKEYLTKQGKTERSIRHIKALKTISDLRNSWDHVDCSDDEDEEDEEEEREGPLEDGPAPSFNRAYDLPYMFQVMELFRNVGARGFSQRDLWRILSGNKLSVRRVVKFLVRSNYLRTVTQDRGRQKVLMFVAVENVQENKTCQNIMKEIVKYGTSSTGELDKLATNHHKTKERYKRRDGKRKSDNQASICSPSMGDEKLTEPSTSGVKVKPNADEKIVDEQWSGGGEIITREIINDPQQSKRDITTAISQSSGEVITNLPQSGGEIITDVSKLQGEIGTDSTQSGDIISSIHRELDKVDEGFCPTVAGLSHEARKKREVLRQIISEDESLVKVRVEELYQTKPGSNVLGLKRFGSMLSESHVRRINWIVEVVTAIKAIESFRMLKLLRNREKEMQIPTSMDNKSLKRLIVALTEDKKIRCFNVHIKMGEKNKELTYLCAPEVDEKSATLLRHLEEAKLRYFSVSREEVKKYQKPKKEMAQSTKPNSLTIPGVPDTACESIREYMEYRKKWTQGQQKMKYNRKAGVGYGLLPKMLRIQAAHQYLFHLCYDTYGNDVIPVGVKASDADKKLTIEEDVTTMNAADKVIQPVMKDEDEGWPSHPPVYFDEWTWRRHLSPVPVHSGFSKGWCLLSDVLLRLPVYLFCQIVNVCYDIDGLQEILQNTKKKFYPLINLPLNISQQLLHSKKYVSAFLELCNYLCEMGLLTFAKEAMREQTFVYLHQNASLLDTRESLRGYNKTTAPENVVFPTKYFRFEKLSDLHGFWESLQIIALTSNLSFKSRCQNDLNDQQTFVVRSLKDVTEPCSVEDVIDDGVIPGDRRGAAGMDSSLFVHCLRNWTFRSMTRTAVGDKPYPKSYLTKALQAGVDIIGRRKIVDTYNEGLRLKGQDRLLLWDDPKKPIEIKKVKRENVKINRGGKGIKKNLQSKRVYNRPDKRPKFSKLGLFVPKAPKRKKACDKGDDKDRAIYSTRTKHRVVWTEKEDSMLLMCRLATMIMDNSRKVSVVSYMTMRDFLHENCGELSKDKSSQTCNRRLKFVLKNKNTESNLLLYYREAIQDEYIVKNYMSKLYINTDDKVIPCFKSLTHYLIQKFQKLNIQKCTLPASLKELSECNVEPIEKLSISPLKQYKDVTCKEDICKDVLRNILHSAVLLRDKQSRTHEMFKLLTQYPELLLSDVIKELRADGLFVIQKKNYQREAISQLHAGLGLRNFKVSQRYMYSYKHRYLSTLFEESAEFLDKLCQNQQGGGDTGMILDFHPKGGQSAILIPLVLQRMINLRIKMPSDLVVIDMEGFRNFPWGRGKSSTHRSDHTLQALQNKTHPRPGPSGMSIKSTTGTQNSSVLEEGIEESEAILEGNRSVTDSDAVTEIFGSGEPVSYEIDGKEVQSREDITDVGKMDLKEQKMDTEEEGNSDNWPVVQIQETSDKPVRKTGESDKHADGAMDYKLSQTSAANTDSGLLQTEDTSGFSESRTGDKKVDYTDKDSESFLTEKSDKTDKLEEYSILKNGSSTILMPANEQKFSLDQSLIDLNCYHGVASRTLISLRRAEGPVRCTVEDIRLFNAQDNFVVKSCEIEIKIRKSGLGSDKVKREENKDGGSSEKAPEDGAKFINRLMPPKLKMKELWNELQRLLPFKLDISEMWKSMAINHRISEDTLVFFKQVYQLINSHGELGIKMFDLKRHFSDSIQWQDAIKMLAHYAAGFRRGGWYDSCFGKDSFLSHRGIIVEIEIGKAACGVDRGHS